MVEAAPRSGSLITARRAAECGREVMAVPGSPLDPRAQGCNQLIREGATLVQTAEDVLEAISPLADPARSASPSAIIGAGRSRADADDRAPRRVAACSARRRCRSTSSIRQSGLPPAIVQTVLLELELAGRLERHAGGRSACED